MGHRGPFTAIPWNIFFSALSTRLGVVDSRYLGENSPALAYAKARLILITIESSIASHRITTVEHYLP